MAIQTIPYGLPFPVWPQSASGTPQLDSSTFLIDAAGESIALILSAPATKNLRRVYVRTGSVSVGDTVDVRIETVDLATGNPTGTLWATNTNVSLVIGAGDDNVWLQTGDLTADASLTRGDLFAIVLVNGGGGGNIRIVTYFREAAMLPYGDLFTASWTKSSGLPLFVPSYSDGSYEPVYGMFDAGAVNTQTFNSGSGTNERGNIFQLPFPARAAGVWVWTDPDGDYTVKLYDSDGTTVLATTPTLDKDVRGNTITMWPTFVPFTTTADLDANENYRLVVVPSSATSLSMYDFDVPVAAMLDKFPGGQNCHRSVKTAGAWVQTTTSRSYLGLFLTGFSDGLGGGGSSLFFG